MLRINLAHTFQIHCGLEIHVATLIKNIFYYTKATAMGLQVTRVITY